MNKKIIVVCAVGVLIVVAALYLTTNVPSVKPQTSKETPVKPHSLDREDFTRILDAPEVMIIRDEILYIHPQFSDALDNRIYMPLKDLLFIHTWYKNDQGMKIASEIKLNPNNTKVYNEIGYYNSSKRIVFVYPIFTQGAYGNGGFYDYYHGVCDSRCLTVSIPDKVVGKYTSSIRGAAILSLLNYPYISDVDIDKDPDILKNYDRIILLHNEYVTKREFDAITSHPDVVYLFPNALYAQVKSDYASNTITLVRGHSYPTKDIANGFDWKFDNSRYEYDSVCNDWRFDKTDNGKMLDCYPSFRLYYDKELLRALKN